MIWHVTVFIQFIAETAMANVSKVANRYVLKAAGAGQDHVATESEERYQRYDNMALLSCVFF